MLGASGRQREIPVDSLTNSETSVVAEHEAACVVLARVAEQIGRALVGQREVVEHVLMALFAGGHVPVSYTHLTLPTTPYV